MTARTQALDNWIRNDFRAMNTALEREYAAARTGQSTTGIG